MASSESESAKSNEKGTAFFWQSTSVEPQINPLSFRHGISKVSLGNGHSVLLTFNSEVYTFGDNAFGQLGLGDLKRRRDPTKLAFFGGKHVFDVACGGQHSSVICNNGEVFSWGDSSSGQCGIGDAQLVDSPTRVVFTHEDMQDTAPSTLSDDERKSKPISDRDDVRIKSIACGDSHTMALSCDGTVWSWGSGCQTGHGFQSSNNITTPKKVAILKGKDVISIVCGAYHSMALVKDNSMQIKIIPEKSGNAKLLPKNKKETKKLLKKRKESLKRKKSSSGKSQSPSLLQSSDMSPRISNAAVGSGKSEVQSNATKTYMSYETASHHKRDLSQGSISASDCSIDNISSSVDSNQDNNELCNTMTDEQNSKEQPVQNSELDGNPSDTEHQAPFVQNNDDKAVSCPSHSKEIYDPDNNPEEPGSESIMMPSNVQHALSMSPPSSDPIDIQSNHFGHSKMKHEFLEGSSPELSPPNFPYKRSSENIAHNSFVTTEVSGSIHLPEASSDQDAKDGASSSSESDKGELRRTSQTSKDQPEPGRSYLGFGMLASQFPTDMYLGRLTNAVVDSVTGMFLPSATAPLLDPTKSIKPSSPCKKCGVPGLCFCGEVSGEAEKFWLPGSDTQVWTWGRGGCGQLGHGDTDDRDLPCLVEELSGTGIIKIAAGTFHSLSLTIYCQVFSWGDNSCGQLGQKKAIAIRPKKVKCFSDVLIWDIACGSHYSLFAGDMALNRPDVYVCGRQPSEVAVIAAAIKKTSETRVVSHDDISLTSKDERHPILRHSRSFDDTKERCLGAAKVELVRLMMFRKVGVIRSVAALNESCCCLAARDGKGKTEVLSELASEERLFYYQLGLIWQVVLVPVIQSDVWSMMLQEDSGQLLVQVIKAFHQVMRCVATNLITSTRTVQDMAPFEELYSGCLGKEFIAAFESYSEVFSNAVAYGVFMFFSTVSRDIAVQCKVILRELLEETDEDFIGDIEALQCVTQVPLVRMQHYVTLAKKYLALLSKESAEATRLSGVIDVWSQVMWLDEQRQLVAEQTRQFWEECPSRIAEAFRVPRRRLLRSSKTHALYPIKSARFSSPSYILFDDYFVHVQSNKNYQAYPLNTLWAESVADSEPALLHTIKLTSPEDVLLVSAPCAVNKADWLFAINQAVARIISKTTAYRLGSDAVNTSTGNLSAAIAREATYTFTQDLRYKGATYEGMWLSGKPHGHGEMRWPDKRLYMGEFKLGVHHGQGVMVFPPNSPDNADRYEGQWCNGKISGFGKMRYSNGDTYKGQWRDNARNAYGVMSYGAMSSSAASVYIGEWSGDRKHGYGTMDDVLKGEKYMGMWDNDFRQGAGVIVTLDGLYSQGTFLQGRMMGSGLLLCDDNTMFEGEFSGHCQLAGKGVLTLANGDSMDGTFVGQWGDGIKINGTFNKQEKDTGARNNCKDPEVKSFIPPDRKWKALFQECREKLGCYGDQDAEPLIVWKCISTALMNGHDSRTVQAQHDLLQELLNTNNEMERAENFSLDHESLQNYLAKAFDMTSHPLGDLVSDLVYAFRATYIGMGTHRRLLSHAVAEAKSFTRRLYRMIRLMFPELPNEDYVHLATDTVTGISSHPTEESTVSSALLHPVLLPRLYPPLFTLYALHNERNDSKYWERILLLNKRSDHALMTYVDVKREFWLTKDTTRSLCQSEEKDESCEAHHYVKAVEELQHISTKLSPMEKLGVLKSTFEKVNEEVEYFWQGKEKLVSLDEIFPVFHFIVIRARIPHLGSEIHFIDDMVDSHVHVGEQGHMFTTLKACFFQIQNEKG